MDDINISILLASIIAIATPVVIATLGETISEKAGIINLSLDGSILLSAMTAFAISYETNSLILGFFGAAIVGAFIAIIIAYFSINLGQSQIAVGFVLTLMTRDLAYFLGNSYTRIQGPQVLPFPIPFLKDIPYIGDVFFNHNLPVYFSLALIGMCYWYFYKTSFGLKMRSVGENPVAAFTRGIDPKKYQFFYCIIGGMLVGIAGATFSLSTKAGWGRPQGAEGTGWIALALVIFGGWSPIKAAIGAYLFAFLQVMGIYFQNWFPDIPLQVFQVAPFPIMIFTLLLMSLSQKESVVLWAENKLIIRKLLNKFLNTAPASLGKSYKND